MQQIHRLKNDNWNLHNKNSLDGYLQKQSPSTECKKYQYTQLLNLLQLWTHSLLYHKKLYPSEAFQLRTVLDIPVHVAKSTSLQNYLDTFFNRLKPHLSHLNHLEVKIYSDNQLVETSRLTICVQTDHETMSEQQNVNILQNELEIKRFLKRLPEMFGKGFNNNEGAENVDFKLSIAYRLEDTQGLRKQKRKLIDEWVPLEKPQKKVEKLLGTLRLPLINLLYEIQ